MPTTGAARSLSACSTDPMRFHSGGPVTVLVSPTIPVQEPLATRRSAAGRFFFVALATVYLLVQIVGFVPNYFGPNAIGSTLHPVAKIHGGLMFVWVFLFLLQASLVAAGSLRLHRTLGVAWMALAILIALSMIVASLRQLAANVDAGEFFLNIPALQLMLLCVFVAFVTGAYVWRHRPAVHKRLLTITMASLTQPATDRMLWLPAPGFPTTHWGLDLYVYLLLVPLYLYDAITLRRIHPVTPHCGARQSSS